MKLFKKPWLEIAKMDIEDVLTVSGAGVSSTPDDFDPDNPGGGEFDGDYSTIIINGAI